MKQADIDKAFEGRWRMKRYILENIDGKAAKEIARDFFEAGLALGAMEYVPLEKLKMNMEAPMTEEESKVIYTYPGDYSEVLFRRWWKLYDKMVGRKDCEKKWHKLKRSEQEACVRVAPAYVASTPDKQFRKNPLTYLNQKAWNDEIIMKNGTDKPTTDAADKLADILVG